MNYSLAFLALAITACGGGDLSDDVADEREDAEATTITGLNFPSNGQTSSDIRFKFTGKNLPPMYPATYIWRVNLRQQTGYYTTFFWGPDGAFTGDDYYGAHPYPDTGATGRTHKWEISAYGRDYVKDQNGNSTQLGYNVWRKQALRVWDDGTYKVHDFFWDVPNMNRLIRVKLHRGYGTSIPFTPALTFGDAPWNLRNERLSGVLRGIQIYSTQLKMADIQAEVNAPLSTSVGRASIWYLNLNPTPSDISDKSGKGHHPVWTSSARPSLWRQ
jgi:hypothetical protein